MRTKSTKPEDIKNPEHYFNRMIALEVKRDEKKEKGRKAVEIPFEDREDRLFNRADDIRIDDLSFADGSLEWLNVIENDDLFNAIKALSEKEQKILIYYAIGGLQHKEIASIFDCPRQSITRIISKCRKKLKKMLKG